MTTDSAVKLGWVDSLEHTDEDFLVELMALEIAGFPERERWSARSWESEIDRDANMVFTLRQGKTLVGAALFGVLEPDSELLRIVIAPKNRGDGLGARLLSDVICSAASSDAQRMLLEVRADNAAALALYRRSGFTEIAQRENYYGPGATAIVMLRELTADDKAV